MNALQLGHLVAGIDCHGHDDTLPGGGPESDNPIVGDGKVGSEDVDPIGATDPRSPTARVPESARARRGELPTGERLGTYRIVGFVGAGGMGEIYRAVDELLHRTVAIKVVRVGIFAAEDAGAARERLLHEAQAMARVSHPNVVTVYEAGVAGDQVFIAMEYVNGVTLRAYLAGQRTWREILDCFIAAGRGLAAAHRAGLVHRDFKPDNVLVGEDGRVRVTDFGLAGTPASDLLAIAAANELSPIVSYSHAMAGTPAYMSPEQHEAKPLDARTDLFAFCVALWEALYGERPFAGKNLTELRTAVIQGDTVEPRAARGVPPWVRSIVARGLRPRREDRFAGMDALLDALGRDPAARRRRALAIAGIAALGGVAMFGLLRSPRGSVCTGGEARLAGLWDDGVRGEVRARFAATGRPYAEDTYRRVAAILDGYTADWLSMRRDACEATAVRHEQSDALLDLRMACLDRRAGELGALSAVWRGAADGEMVDRAVPAALKLSEVGGCADAAGLGTAGIPSTASGRLLGGGLRARLEAARARLRSGRFKEGLTFVAPVVAEAHALSYAGLLGEALYVQAQLQEQAGDLKGAKDTLDGTILAAAQAKDDTLVAQAWTLLVFIDGRLSRFDEALTVSQTASAAVVRAGDTPRLQSALALHTATILRAKGNIAGGRELLEKAIAAQEKGRLDPLDRAIGLNSLGLALRDEGRLGEARETLRRALSIYEKELGPEHPSVAGILNNLATVDRLSGNVALSGTDLGRALAIWERALGPDHPNVARALTNLGPVLKEQGKYAEAHAAYERALAIKEKRLGPDHAEVASTLTNLGALLFEQDRLPEARAYHERALAIREKAMGPDSEAVGESLTNIGDVLAVEGAYAEARVRFERALAIYTKSRGPEHPLVAGTLVALGALELNQDRLDAALGYARRALAIDEKAYPGGNPEVAGAVNLVGDILDRQGTHTDARVLHERAVAILEKLGGANDLTLAGPLTALGECELAQGKAGEAVAVLERAAALRGDHGGGPIHVAETRFALARALWDSGGDRRRAVTLATQARDGARHGHDRAGIEAWLAAHAAK
jgi:serine/threonine-protein kinase